MGNLKKIKALIDSKNPENDALIVPLIVGTINPTNIIAMIIMLEDTVYAADKSVIEAANKIFIEKEIPLSVRNQYTATDLFKLALNDLYSEENITAAHKKYNRYINSMVASTLINKQVKFL